MSTSRTLVRLIWGCAAIVMIASAGNAVLTFGVLGGNRAIGLGLGTAVDVALCVGLIGDRQLASHGLVSTWGRVLRITAAVMSIVLNVGAAVVTGHYFLAVLHTFLPVLLVVLTEYGQDVLLKFAAIPVVSQPAELEVQEPADTQPPALLVVPPLPAGPAPSHPKSKRDRPDVSGLSRDEICARYGVSRATAYRWRQESQEAMA